MPATAEIPISHTGRIVYPDCGISKGDVADYYRAIAPWMLPELARRPLSLLRCPDGIGQACFFQKHYRESLGAQVRAIALDEKRGGRENYLYVADAAGLLELVQMNALEFHVWAAHADAPEQPDRLVFDLDPGADVAWKAVVAGAREIRAQLAVAGLQSFVRLSGGKGIHVVAPIRRGPGWDDAALFCERIARNLALRYPERYLATAAKALRKNRIFIDWLRNTRGATSVASWSLRARAGAPVAMPLRWNELARTRSSADYNLSRALQRAAMLDADPWAGIDQLKQDLPPP